MLICVLLCSDEDSNVGAYSGTLLESGYKFLIYAGNDVLVNSIRLFINITALWLYFSVQTVFF